jgi:6-phospho-3-hexuloisomerase
VKGTPTLKDYQELAETITDEIAQVLKHVKPGEVNRLIQELVKADKVFVFAVGRVFLALHCFGKRLGHLGIDCQVVGAVNEKPIGSGDLLLIASGSGESKLPVEIARIGRSKEAALGLITSAGSSTISDISDFAVHLPCPTKNDAEQGVKSIQSMSTLFDQSLHVFGDVVAIMIQERKGLENEALWRYHANLE